LVDDSTPSVLEAASARLRAVRERIDLAVAVPADAIELDEGAEAIARLLVNAGEVDLLKEYVRAQSDLFAALAGVLPR
jgi:hypothetical protein